MSSKLIQVTSNLGTFTTYDPDYLKITVTNDKIWIYLHLRHQSQIPVVPNSNPLSST